MRGKLIRLKHALLSRVWRQRSGLQVDIRHQLGSSGRKTTLAVAPLYSALLNVYRQAGRKKRLLSILYQPSLQSSGWCWSATRFRDWLVSRLWRTDYYGNRERISGATGWLDGSKRRKVSCIYGGQTLRWLVVISLSCALILARYRLNGRHYQTLWTTLLFAITISIFLFYPTTSPVSFPLFSVLFLCVTCV